MLFSERGKMVLDQAAAAAYSRMIAAVQEQILYIGGDLNNPHLAGTPRRVVESWKELFSGYEWDDERIKEMLTEFDEPCNQMVMLRGIEFNSTCAHHMLPFVGTAHIGYLPDGNKVVGASKLARLLDIHAHRFQIQERVGTDVVKDLQRCLSPKGSACIIIAKHLCISCRGVGKQHSELVTSERKGCFEDAGSDSWREFLALTKV